jgi:hypothetical protein
MSKNNTPWYKPGPEFQITDAAKEFFIMLALTFIAGGLNAVIGLLESSSGLLPQEYVAYSGLILAGLRAIYTIVKNYKNGL